MIASFNVLKIYRFDWTPILTVLDLNKLIFNVCLVWPSNLWNTSTKQQNCRPPCMPCKSALSFIFMNFSVFFAKDKKVQKEGKVKKESLFFHRKWICEDPSVSYCKNTQKTLLTCKQLSTTWSTTQPHSAACIKKILGLWCGSSSNAYQTQKLGNQSYKIQRVADISKNLTA